MLAIDIAFLWDDINYWTILLHFGAEIIFNDTKWWRSFLRIFSMFSQLYSIMTFGSNIDADLATTESNAALSNNLLTICVRKILASSLNFISLETLTKSFDHSILSFASAANPRSRSLIRIWFDVLLISMFIREDPLLVAAMKCK